MKPKFFETHVLETKEEIMLNGQDTTIQSYTDVFEPREPGSKLL